MDRAAAGLVDMPGGEPLASGGNNLSDKQTGLDMGRSG